MTSIEIRALLAETHRVLMTSRQALKATARAARSSAKPDHAPAWSPELAAEFQTPEIYRAWLAAEARGSTICHGAL